MTKQDIPISACIIAQNEEKYIDRALSNLHPNVAEIIVIDGGSTDKTIEICNQYKDCKIIKHKFEFDFAKQRNLGMEQCSKDWILFCDADEYFSDEFFDLLPTLVLNPPANYVLYDVFRISEFDGYKPAPEYQPRLMRKDSCQWKGKIHEGVQFRGQRLRVPAEYPFFHNHTMNRQRFNNALYYNLNNDIKQRPNSNLGMEYDPKKKVWNELDNLRDK